MTAKPRRLAVVFGGGSVEHTISIRSARAVIAAADSERWRIQPFAVSRYGQWLSAAASEQALREIECGAPEIVPSLSTDSPTIPPETIASLSSCDAVFPLIHGASGEDGVLQGLLESLRLPYVGPGVAASAIAMDKDRCKRLLSSAGIAVAPWIAFSCDDWHSDPDHVMRAAAEFGYPYFVKPSRGGSSIGISQVLSREDAPAALQAAFACDRDILIEQAMLSPREIECGVLGSLNGQPPIASPPGEIRTSRGFYDYAAKYEDPNTELIAPTTLDAEIDAHLRETSLRAYHTIGAEGMLRADFLVGADGQVWLGELNTIPGFTSASMYPLLFESEGIPFSALINRLVELGIERQQRQARMLEALA